MVLSNIKLRNIINLIKKGKSFEDISLYLDWKDFENLVSKILLDHDFNVNQNVILHNPKMEIDIIGTKMNFVFLIDCKHWTINNTSLLKKAVSKQIIRSSKYISTCKNLIGFPIIVTLYNYNIRFINKVPIVSISKLPSFLNEFYNYKDKLMFVTS